MPKIVVLIKEVPDTYGDRTLDLQTGLIERAGSDVVVDEICERALEVALRYAESATGTDVVAVSMAPASAEASLRRCLAMGATSAVQVVDDELRGADATLTAEVLAAAAQKIGADLVVAGNLSTDGTGGVVAAMIAEILDRPAALNLSSIDISDSEITGIRVTDTGTVEVSASMPAVASITEALPEARLPNFKGIMAAKKKQLDTLTLADLGVRALPEDAARSIMISLGAKPARGAGEKVVDDGDAGEKLAEYLVKNRLV